MALDTGASPDVDSSAGDIGGDTGGGESQDPTLADMDAIMASEAAVDDAAGFELGATIPPPGKPKQPEEKKPDEPAAEAAKPAETPAEVPAADAPPAVDPATAKLAEESARLRRANARLAKDREAVVAKVNEANAAIERAKSLEAKAKQFDELPDRFAADPLAFMFKLAGKETPADQEEFLNGILNKVIETEKSPIEREMMQLRRELADKEAAQQKAQAERDQRETAERNARIISDWRERNVSVAKADPEKYDLILSLGQEEAVHETCLAYHKLHNTILDPVIAANEVEKALRAGVQKSKFIKSLGQSTPAANGKPATAAPAANAQRSNTPTAPKQTGPRTLAAVQSGDSAPSATEYPEDEDARFEAVKREMQAEGLI